MKIITILLTALIAFSGCTVKEYVYVEPKCPAIKALPVVPDINIEVLRVTGEKRYADGNVAQVDSEPCICGEDTGEIIGGAKYLRKSETYYKEQVDKYNDEFAK